MKPIEQKDLDVLIKIQENNEEILEKVKKINAKIEQIVNDEEYTPKEPLIKNNEIRKIIRLWTKVNDVVGLTYNAGENSLTDIFRNEIHFNEMLGLEDGCFYTTKELCGGVGRMTEPLIKDEKIRKAVRAWAEVCGIDGVVIVSKYQLVSLDKPCSVEFYGAIYPDYVHNEEHTIAELCGEEEE